MQILAWEGVNMDEFLITKMEPGTADHENDGDDDDGQFKSIGFGELFVRRKLKRKRQQSTNNNDAECCYACKHDLITSTDSNNNVFDDFWEF